MAHQKGVLRTDREVGTVPIGKARGAVRSCGQKRVSFFERFLSVCPEPVLVNVRFLVDYKMASQKQQRFFRTAWIWSISVVAEYVIISVAVLPQRRLCTDSSTHRHTTGLIR